ncbi:MAG TPA: sigma-70 family RNA polymerase sigma factor, partial [Treponemataceae bacterium]|nr:sigma-70 family RNA polymerase sigma factor [Treponemataceae bacterium]
MNSSNLHNNIDNTRSMERAIIEKRDKSLISSACAGDSRSFARLVSFYEKKVRAFGMGFFKNSSDTDDFIQEVFIKVYAHLSTFRGESLFSTWLMRIAYNT